MYIQQLLRPLSFTLSQYSISSAQPVVVVWLAPAGGRRAEAQNAFRELRAQATWAPVLGITRSDSAAGADDKTPRRKETEGSARQGVPWSLEYCTCQHSG